jgi:two-component system LytT family response regulator
MQIRSVIIDDEKHSLISTEILIKKYCPGIEIVGKALTPEQGIQLIETLQPDLVFLDIAMPRINGFELLQALQFKEFALIFTTAYNTYAINAFKVNAIDYLLKPIDPEELIKAIEKVKHNMEKDYQLKRIETIIRSLGNGHKGNERLALPYEGRILMLDHSSIVCCESDRNYTRIHLADKTNLMISRTLKDIEQMLPHPVFVRIHHSYLVNIQHIKEYYRGEGGEILLSNGEFLRVSRNRKEELLNILFQNSRDKSF